MNDDWDQMIRELVEQAGGPKKVIEKMRIRPVYFAVRWLGGVEKMAELLGCSRANLYKLFERPTVDWPNRHIRKVAQLTGLSVEDLWNDEDGTPRAATNRATPERKEEAMRSPEREADDIRYPHHNQKSTR